MDFKRIFIKDACPTKIGGQAVMEGIMMKGEDRSAVVVRLPDGAMHITTAKLKKKGGKYKIPVIRGALIFVDSLLTGMRTLMQSAEVLESAMAEEDADGEGAEEEGRFARWLEEKFGEKAVINFTLITAVVAAIVFTVLIFIIAPTWVMGLFGHWIKNSVALNLIEGVFRIVLFVIYIVLISRLKDIKTVFQFHGAEHRCIHCYENGLELTPANCRKFETLHPRCGTSFLMFVMVISLLLFSLLGWPNLLIRILSRLLLIPVIAGLSYELLRWAGSSMSPIVVALSVPGLLLQRLTTLKPDDSQLEVAIAAVKAVLVPPETPEISGICDESGSLVPEKQTFEDIILNWRGF